MAEIDELRRQLAWANGQLAARDRAEAEARMAAMAKQQKEDDDAASAATQEALATEIETTRRGAWFNFRLSEMVARDPSAKFNPDDAANAIPKTGWPPGQSQDDYAFSGLPVGKIVDDVAQTSMAKMLAAVQERAERLRRAG